MTAQWKRVLLSLTAFIFSFTVLATDGLLQIPLKGEKGEQVSLSKLGSGPVLVVNIATRCGYTGQLDDLEKLYQTYKERGLTVVGIPTNDFGGQTPEGDEEVVEFCRLNYGVNFPILKKVTVVGEQREPLFARLLERTQDQGGAEVRWNFEKFLISRDGSVVKRFNSNTKPLDKNLTQEIERLL